LSFIRINVKRQASNVKRKDNMKPKSIKVGILGCGTVGAGVVRCLLENNSHIERHIGARIEIKKISDLYPKIKRDVKIPSGLMTKNSDSVINDPEIDIIIELIGGTTISKKLIIDAMNNGKHVVTANKALLAVAGKELHKIARKNNVGLFYEASVAGGIPIIKALREGFTANKINSLFGIVNGTCNYIFCRMFESNLSFDRALEEAMEKGYAEADPTLDIEGIDSKHKIGIAASLAFGQWIPQKSIYVEGITKITDVDVKSAMEMGYKIKLLAIAKFEDEKIEVRVHPTLIPESSLLSSVNGVFNAVEVDGFPIGKTMFYGQGAGMHATASAVVADIVDIARNILHDSPQRLQTFSFGKKAIPVKKIADIETRYFIRCTVLDRPSVIAHISAELGKRNISISSVIQHEEKTEEDFSIIIFMTHTSRERDVQSAIKAITKLPEVKEKPAVIRVEA